MSVRRRSKRSYQVRVTPFPAKSFPTREAAERYELELLVRRSQGDHHVELSRTLAEEIDGWLKRWKATRSQSPRTVQFYERSAMVWGQMGSVPVSAVRRAPVEDLVAERAADHPRSAQNELAFLKRVLRDARSRGQRIDEAVLAIDPVKAPPRRGRALTVEQLYEFASWFPEHTQRLILLAGMVGARQRVWFELTDNLLDLKDGILEITPELAKNARAHRVFLTPLEVKLFREQLLVRAPGTRLVFPTAEGKQWTANRFRDRVWVKGVAKAIEHQTTSEGSGAFEGFTFHLLRHTACSLMASAGMDPAVAAERAGHTDGGALFMRTYRHLYEAEKRSQALRLEAKILSDLDAIWTENEPEGRNRLNQAGNGDGRYWARTSDPQLVELVLSQLS